MKTFTTIFLSLFALMLTAQTTLQVVTKTVQKTMAFKAGYGIEIIAEKADIEVDASNSDLNNIGIKAELTTRHPNLDSAKMDLDAWKFVCSQIGKTIYIRAYIGLQSGKALPTSNLKAKIVVKVPPTCALTLNNKYGKAQISHIQGTMRLTGEFCPFVLNEITGPVQINTQYGNIQGQNLDGKVNIQSKRSDIQLDGIRGDCSIQSEYGAIHIQNVSPASNITVNGGKTDVRIQTLESRLYNFDLKALHGNLDLPLSLQFDPATVRSGQSLQRNLGKSHSRIKVDTNFGKITIY